MATVIYDADALADLARLMDFRASEGPAEQALVAGLITGAIEMLAEHPIVGRSVELGFRELVISRGKSGYLALYDYDEEADRVNIRAIRHQREGGYRDPTAH